MGGRRLDGEREDALPKLGLRNLESGVDERDFDSGIRDLGSGVRVRALGSGMRDLESGIRDWRSDIRELVSGTRE